MTTPDKKARGFITGKLYFQNKEFKMAEKCIVEYLVNKPDDISALMLLAQIYENMKNYLKAFNMYEQCYQLNPERSGILLEICRILMMSEVHLEDVDYRRWLNLAIRAHPANPIVQNLKAFLSTCPINSQNHATVEAKPEKIGSEPSIGDQLKELMNCINQVNGKIDKLDEKIEDLSNKMKQMSATPLLFEPQILASKPSMPVSEPPKPHFELPTPVSKPQMPVFEPQILYPKPSMSVSEPPKPIVEPPKPILEPPKPVFEPPKPVFEPQILGPKPPIPVFEPQIPAMKTQIPAFDLKPLSFGLTFGKQTNLFSSSLANDQVQPQGSTGSQFNLLKDQVSESQIPPIKSQIPVFDPKPLSFGSTFGQQTNLFSSSIANNQVQPQWSTGSQFNFLKEPVFAVAKEAEASEEEVVEADDIPIVADPSKPLPPVIDVKTGEEDEDVIFESRAKIYRLRDQEYKERGLGIIKLLQNKHNNHSRLLMRRDLTNLVCLNSPCNTIKSLEKPKENTLKWSSFDFSDNEPTPEVFLVRMKPVIIDSFKSALEQVLNQQESTSVSSSSNEEVEIINPIIVPELVDKARSLKLPDLFYHDLIYRDERVFQNGHTEENDD